MLPCVVCSLLSSPRSQSWFLSVVRLQARTRRSPCFPVLLRLESRRQTCAYRHPRKSIQPNYLAAVGVGAFVTRRPIAAAVLAI
jgi:hypothetical protein